MKRVCLLLVAINLFGCGGPRVDAQATQREYLTIIDREGERRVIPSDQLIDANTGKPSAEKVLAIDRRRGTRSWVQVDELFGAPPPMARYIPLAHTNRDAAPKE